MVKFREIAPVRMAMNAMRIAAFALCCAGAFSAEGAVADLFEDHVVFTVNGSGTEALTGFPLLVRVSEAELPGFTYARSSADALAFTDAGGNALDYDVDTWNESGESIVWVRVPSIPAGGTTVTMHWALKSGETAPANDSTKVWADYAGVWHFNETITSANAATTASADASGHGYDAVPKLYANNASYGDLSQTVSTNGLFGLGRVNADIDTSGQNRNYQALHVESATGLNLKSEFTISGWVRMSKYITTNDSNKKARIFSRKQNYNDATGWQVTISATGSNYARVIAGTKDMDGSEIEGQIAADSIDGLDDYTFIAAVYSNTTVTVFGNGEYETSGTVAAAATDNGKKIAFGGDVGLGGRSFWGSFDEIRICTNALATARLAAEYANARQTGYRTASVESGSFLVPDIVVTNETVGVDYWVDAPSLSLSKWSYGAIVAAELEIFSGSLKSGSSGRVYKARRLDTGDETAISSADDLVSLPPADYRLIATGEGSSVEATFDFSVFCNLNDNFDDKVTFTLNGVGAAPIENFPMLVRVSEELLPGFKYARASSGGKPVIAFGDADGANLHYDVDTWNEGGESLIWVNVPVATNGASVTMYWALKSAGVAPGNSSAKVWADYVGVWHMDDASDASSNSALGEFHDGAVQRDDGMFGGTWGRTVTGVQGPIAAMPRSDAMDALTDDAFTVSGWVRLNSATGNNYPYLFSRKDVNATEAWGVQIDGNGNNSSTRFWVDGTSRTALAYSATYRANEWVHVAYVYGKDYVQMFFDGADLGTKSVTVPTASGDLDFYIGGARADDNGSPGGRTNTLNGDMDEVRLYKGAFSAQRAAAEYANAVFADYKSAVEGDGTSFLVPSLVTTNSVQVDYWVAQPSLAKTLWIAGSVSGGDLALDFGMLRSGGSVACKAVNTDTGTETAVATGDDVAALPAGSYRLVCDSADTDVAAAELQFAVQDNLDNVFADHVTLTLNEVGTTPVANYALLVRVSEAQLPGFSYARAVGNIAFAGEDGLALPYDIDTWKADGESLIWVNVPVATNGTKVTFYWAQKDGAVAPENDPAAVWADYAGVWHFNETITRGVAATTASKDSSGKGHDAVPTTTNGGDLSEMVSTNAVFGLGRLNGTTSAVDADGANRLVVAHDDALNFNGEFTFSGWVKFLNYSGEPRIVSKAAVAGNPSDGFQITLHQTYRNAIRVSSNGGGQVLSNNFVFNSDNPKNNSHYTYISVVYSQGKVSVYGFDDGTVRKYENMAVASVTNNTNNLAFGGGPGGNQRSMWGGYDEFRIRYGATSLTTLEAEYNNAQFTDYKSAVEGAGGGFLVPGVVTKDGVEIDYWMSKPSLSPLTWEEGDAPTITFTPGKLRSGATITNWCVNAVNFEVVTNEISQAALAALKPGSYCIYSESMGSASCERVETYFTVAAAVGVDTVGDTAGGRILLLNNDCKVSGDRRNPEISHQGYADNRTTDSTYWQHLDVDSISAFNLRNGTSSILWAQGDIKLWHLNECRHGNTFPRNNDTVQLSTLLEQNFLPWSTTSLRSSSYNSNLAMRRRDVGQILMRDTKEATVYSPCYTNGIGTIYFDAVNGWNDNIYSYTGIGSEVNPNAYQLVVEMATATLDGLEPTDANCWTFTDVTNELGEVISVTTNWYGNLDDTCWAACTVYPVRVCGETLTADAPTEVLSLDIAQGGSMTNYYRVYVPVDLISPVRFRIRRVSVDTSQIEEQDNRVTSFILLDNIIVSEPRSRVELKPAGWYDRSKSGKGILGQECAFSSPFPMVGESVYACAVPEYTFATATPPEETNLVASARMHWRWRYLNQKIDDGWSVVALDTANGFVSPLPVALPVDEGDVEFWFDADLQIPYYKYVDYSGQDLEDEFAAVYTERQAAMTNRAAAAEGYYPTCGTDWFVRLREAPSDTEIWRLWLKNADGSAYDADGNGSSYVDFTLSGTGNWRAFARTPSSVEEGLLYRVEQLNPQSKDAYAFGFSTNYWVGTTDLEDTARNTTLAAAADETGWSKTYCPGTTGYLMFVLEEKDAAPTIAVTCADYQNFNGWNDANRNAIMFVGTSAENGDKTGVSPSMRLYGDNFSSWTPCSATNAYWAESFIGQIGGTGSTGYKGYEPFESARTPNGWQAGAGMWVHEKFRNTGMAYQMLGRGQGYLNFANTAIQPRGIESISFKTRLAQSLTVDDLYLSDVAPADSPWYGSNRALTNYTFVVQAAMSDVNTTSVSMWEPGFDGSGQISVFGGYRPGRGGYELRLTRIQDKRYEATLYRWDGATVKSLVSTPGSHNYGSLPFTKFKGNYPTLFMGVQYQTDGSCKVTAGFTFGDQNDTSTTEGNTGHSAVGNLPGSGRMVKMCYWDPNPPSKSWGTFGIASVNCPAEFASPRIYSAAVPFPGWAASGTDAVTKGGTAKYGGWGSTKGTLAFSSNTAFGFSGGKWTSLSSGIDDDWTAENSNFTIGTDANKLLHANAPSQSLLVQTWSSDLQDWQTLTNMTISSFTLSDTITVPIYSKNEAPLRLKHGGAVSDDTCTDITVDDVEVRQWRGDDYDSVNQRNFRDTGYGSPTNFVFTSTWVHGEGSAELSAKRAETNAVSSIRSPLFDGLDGRGIGLGMFSFSYTNADSRAKILLQVATNANVGVTTLASYTKYLADDSRWTTVTNFDFSVLDDAKREGGVMTHYMGLHGQKGIFRIVVDPETVAAAELSGDADYGRVFVTEVLCRDEPVLDTASWWGWNMRTGTGLYDTGDLKLAYLADYPDSGSARAGMSGALNNSVSDDIDESDFASYRQHQPFIQTPTFTNGTEVGQFFFKARRYDTVLGATARVSVFGANPLSRSTDVSDDGAWTYVTHFDVTNSQYQTYSFKAKPGQSFEVLRFVVVGMDSVAQKHGRTTDPAYKGLDRIVRVALDELVVTEALRPKMAFRNVFAFRNDPKVPETDFLSRSFINGYGDMTKQPLAGESWGVQAEVYAAQLPDEIDFERGVKVTLYWYDGEYTPWGFSNWEAYGTPVDLAECTDKELVFRSCFAEGCDVESVLPEQKGGAIVQYMLKAEYYTFDSEEPMAAYLTASEWKKPDWYRGVDFNRDFAASKSFAAYCLFDTVAPGWAWINEANVFGGYNSSYGNLDENRQYIEVAMPVEADLKNWRLEMISNTGITNTVCTFGPDNDAASTKSVNAASNCVFLVVSSPESKANLEAMTVDVGGVPTPVTVDGTWSFKNADYWAFDKDGTLGYYYPVGARLVRPSGVIEHEIVFEGTNIYADISAELAREYSAAEFAKQLNATDPDGGWVAVGSDSMDDGLSPASTDKSLGETGRSAAETTLWLNSMRRTPGFINQYQVIDSDHPTPNGTSYLVYASIAPSAGHMTQTLADKTNTTEMITAVVQKGFGREIVYNLENWYELDAVSVNGKNIDLPQDRSGKVSVMLGGASTSNNLTVVASSRVNEELSGVWGLTPDNRYTPAVVSWLNGGSTLRGGFKHPEGPISPSQFVPLSRNPDAARPMTLTEMYWLDIDPTESNWWFVAGMIKPPSPVVVKPEYAADHDAENNVRMGVYMCLTNTASGERFAPYVLRGVAPDETSWQYAAGSFSSWTGASFKVTGILANDMPYNIGWVPLRWFVFDSNSFTPAGSGEEFQSSIEILDPYSTASPGYVHGWSEWRGRANVFYSWTIEDGRNVYNIDTLCPTNWISQ